MKGAMLSYYYARSRYDPWKCPWKKYPHHKPCSHLFFVLMSYELMFPEDFHVVELFPTDWTFLENSETKEYVSSNCHLHLSHTHIWHTLIFSFSDWSSCAYNFDILSWFFFKSHNKSAIVDHFCLTNSISLSSDRQGHKLVTVQCRSPLLRLPV